MSQLHSYFRLCSDGLLSSQNVDGCNDSGRKPQLVYEFTMSAVTQDLTGCLIY